MKLTNKSVARKRNIDCSFNKANYNKGYRLDAINFNLLDEESGRKKSDLMTFFRKLPGIILYYAVIIPYFMVYIIVCLVSLCLTSFYFSVSSVIKNIRIKVNTIESEKPVLYN